MPIKVLNNLPSVQLLHNENIFIMTSSSNKYQSIRSLKLLILNLMPIKIETETHLFRLLSNSPLQIKIYLLRIDNRKSKNTSSEHLNHFYYKFEDIKNINFDGLIVTGAPLGLLSFNDVSFWPQMNIILHWAKENISSILFICWAVQAALNILYGMPKITRKKKLLGIFQHKTLYSNALLTRGFDDMFLAPHSRYADFPIEIINKNKNLEILSSSEDVGAYLFISKDKQITFVTGHPEYDAFTLANEYYRDVKNGLNSNVPLNYFPENNPNLIPKNNWRSHSYLLFSNWLNYYMYQNKT